MTRTNDTPQVLSPALLALLESSPCPMAICDPAGFILAASSALPAQSIGTSVKTALPSQTAPVLLGQPDPMLRLYAWLRPEALLPETESPVFRLALEQLGVQVFEYHIAQDTLRFLVPAVPPDTQHASGGPELLAARYQVSEEDALYLADSFAAAAFGRSAALDFCSHAALQDQWLRLILSPVQAESRTSGVVMGTLQDITMQKLAEQQATRDSAFRNNVLTGISSAWELDLESNRWHSFWNGEPVLNYSSQEQLYYEDYDRFCRETLFKYVHPDDWAPFYASMDSGALLARFRRGERSGAVEYRIRCRPAADAPYEWRSLTVQLQRDPITRRPKASCHVSNINQQKARELAAQRDRRLMEEIARREQLNNARRSQYLADTSRTLRDPMRAMIGVSELALQEQMSDTAREYLSQLHDFVGDLLGILVDALELASNSEQQELSAEEEYDPSELLQTAARIARSHDYTGADLEISMAEDMPSRLYGDSIRLQQALINLLCAAMRAGKTVSLHLSSLPLDAEHVLFRAEMLDASYCPTEDEMDNLFVAFAQTDARYGGGTGLGMSQARQLIRLMGGELDAEALPEGGIRFLLCVPQQVIDLRPVSIAPAI